MSRWISSSTLCLGLGLCLGTSQAKADISLNTAPGLPSPGTGGLIVTNGYTAGFFQNDAIKGLTSFPSGLVDGAPAPPPGGGLPTGLTTYFDPVVVGGGFPIPPWLANTAASSWIGPTKNGGAGTTALPDPNTGWSRTDSSPQGYFYYDKSFTVSSTGAHLVGGLWATDNNGISIYLNGHNEGNVTSGTTGFINFNSFSVNPADFVLGTNHIDFVVFNENFDSLGHGHSSPTGLRVEGSVVVPEPSTMAVAALGAIGFISYGLRRRKAMGV